MYNDDIFTYRELLMCYFQRGINRHPTSSKYFVFNAIQGERNTNYYLNFTDLRTGLNLICPMWWHVEYLNLGLTTIL